jgi:hypothetical protein
MYTDDEWADLMDSTTVSKDFSFTEIDGSFAGDVGELNNRLKKLVDYSDRLKQDLYVAAYFIGEQSFHYKEKFGMVIFEEEMKKIFTPPGKKRPTKSAKTLVSKYIPFYQCLKKWQKLRRVKNTSFTTFNAHRVNIERILTDDNKLSKQWTE